MKKHLNFFVIFFSMLSFTIIAQEKNTLVSSDYSRNSISYHFVRLNDKDILSQQVFKSAKVPDRYDNNNIDNNRIDVPYGSIDILSKTNNTTSEQLDLSVKEQKIANQILKGILYDPISGAMTFDKLSERGLYNADDKQMLIAQNSNQGISALQEHGTQLLRNVYFVAFEFIKLETTEQAKTKSTNYEMSCRATLYKIELDSLLKTGIFWRDLFVVQNNTSKWNSFLNYDFSIEPIRRISYTSSTDNIKKINVGNSILNALNEGAEKKQEITYKSQEEVYKDLFDDAIESAMSDFSMNYEPFTIKEPIFDVAPIRAKIGEKESINIDDLYRVYENRIDEKTGEKYSVKMGYIRVKEVANNKMVANGNSNASTFYRSPIRVIKKGMTIVEEPETGLVFGMSQQFGKSAISGTFLNVEYITHWAPGLRLGLDFGGFKNIKSDTWELNGSSIDGSFTGRNIAFGLNAKKIISFNFFEITPQLGAYGSVILQDKAQVGNVKYDLEDILIANGYSNPSNYKLTTVSIGALGGVNFGLNFTKYFQVNTGLKFGYELYNKTNLYDNDGDKVEDYEDKISYKLSSFSIGIRIIGF